MSIENWIKLVLALVALIGAGSFIAIKFSKRNSNNKSVNQNNNTVTGGDIVGGDKITK